MQTEIHQIPWLSGGRFRRGIFSISVFPKSAGPIKKTKFFERFEEVPSIPSRSKQQLGLCVLPLLHKVTEFFEHLLFGCRPAESTQHPTGGIREEFGADEAKQMGCTVGFIVSTAVGVD